MLALPQRRQHLSQHHHSTLPSPPSPHHHQLEQQQQQQLSFDLLSQQLSAQDLLYNQKLLHDYIESQQQSFATPLIVDDSEYPTGPDQYMTAAYDFANPTIRIQQSTPTPQHSSAFAQAPMQPTNNATASGIDSWNTYSANNVQDNGQSLQAPRTGRTHQRAASSSSIASNGSHYQGIGPTNGYGYVAHSENLPSSPAVKVDSSYTADESSRPFSNHLPTPTHTPTQDSFLNNQNNFNTTFTTNGSGMDSTMAAHHSMKYALMDQHDPNDDVPSFAHSARHSVSSFGHDSPATPHTTLGEEFDENRFKMPPSDTRHAVPKLERTYTDIAADYDYNPNPSAMMVQTQSVPQATAANNASLLSPYRNQNDIVQRTLQAAQNARSQSPSSSLSGGVSPFRHNSPFRQPVNNYSSPRMRSIGSAATQREQKVEADAAYAMKQSSSDEAEPKTISPKDALLTYDDANDESKGSLFPESGASEYEPQYNGGDQYRNATQPFDTTSGRNSWATPQFSPSFSTTTATSQPTAAFAFAPPSISGNVHGLPFSSPTSQSQYRQISNAMPAASDQAPEFPAHLTSMESSVSESDPTGSQGTTAGHDLLQKPASSNADSGTYTCTYHGCTQRFETPQKLQKHKREGHRNANVATTTTTVGTSMTSAALLERNSQAGPHKCERINPTTGKPCNTIFSRPYDLTRHEDTIHNVRKQKVRCALCVEEKTFSRNDALTRHMRVVHPDIDFPGKHRRRGGNHD